MKGMPHEWTDAQKRAINERGRTLLVSAAAGSGKTAVLTERVIRSLLDEEHPADIARTLVVTFTRAAAGELRQKISKALFEAHRADPTDRHLEKQLMMVGSAPISTIDSFYLDLVREHFEQTDLPASFRMADDGELLSLRREIMNGVVDDVKGAAQVTLTHVAYKPQLVTVASLQNGNVTLEDLNDWQIAANGDYSI